MICKIFTETMADDAAQLGISIASPTSARNSVNVVGAMDVKLWSRENSRAGMTVEADIEAVECDVKDDRQGTIWSATGMVIAALLGSASLGLPWAMAQLGWLFGPVVIITVFILTRYTYSRLAECYRYMDEIQGRRLHSYPEAVNAYLGKNVAALFIVVHTAVCVGGMMSTVIKASQSMVALRLSICNEFAVAHCDFSSDTWYMSIFGMVLLIFASLRNFDSLWWISWLSVVLSFAYIGIAVFFAIKLATYNDEDHGSLTGRYVGRDHTPISKMFSIFTAIGSIGFAYSTPVILHIEDTLKGPAPESKTMKKAILGAQITVTIAYALIGSAGYAAYGNDIPEDFVAGLAGHRPLWLVRVCHICIIVQLTCSGQLYAQVLYSVLEKQVERKWGGRVLFNHFRSSIVWRAPWRILVVTVVTVLAISFPSFNGIRALCGALALWPLMVFCPVQIHKMRTRMLRHTLKWLALDAMSCTALFISCAIFAAALRHLIIFSSTSTIFGRL